MWSLFVFFLQAFNGLYTLVFLSLLIFHFQPYLSPSIFYLLQCPLFPIYSFISFVDYSLLFCTVLKFLIPRLRFQEIFCTQSRKQRLITISYIIFMLQFPYSKELGIQRSKIPIFLSQMSMFDMVWLDSNSIFIDNIRQIREFNFSTK